MNILFCLNYSVLLLHFYFRFFLVSEYYAGGWIATDIIVNYFFLNYHFPALLVMLQTNTFTWLKPFIFYLGELILFKRRFAILFPS